MHLYLSSSHLGNETEKLNGELIIKHGQKHFSTSTMGKTYQKFPFLLAEIIKRQKP